MAYSGLETLFQNLGPTTASSFAGEREGIAQGLDQISAATQQQALQKALQDYQQAQMMNPLDAQFKQGQIASQKAQLRGLEGLSKSQVAKGNVDHATQEQDILKAISDGKLKVTENQLKDQLDKASMAGNLGQILKGQDPQFHEDTRRRFLEANGIDPNSSGGKTAMTASPDDLIDTANRITDMSGKMRQAMLETSARIVEGESRNASNERVAGIRADAVGSNKPAGKTIMAGLLTAAPDKRYGAVGGYLASGINPDTGQPLTEIEKLLLEKMHSDDQQLINAKLANQAGQGLIVEAKPNGKAGIANKTAPTVGESKPTENVTKGGVKFKVVP